MAVFIWVIDEDKDQPARQVAVDAATDALYNVYWPNGEPYLRLANARGRKLAAAAVGAAFATLAEGLYIADRGDGKPAVFDETRPPGTQCVIGPDALSGRVWALLAAVVPVREEEA